MKLIKPIEEFSAQELSDSIEFLRYLVDHTQETIEMLNLSNEFSEFIDKAVKATSPLMLFPSNKSFKEMCKVDLNEFKLAYQNAIEECHKRKIVKEALEYSELKT